MVLIMDGTSSNSKLGRCDGKGEDRISRLPDAILSHILSFSTTTKDAVRTTILSKQWRYVWTSVPIVEIYDHALLSSSSSRDENPKAVRRRRRRLFMDFVDRVLRFNDAPCLRKFSLSCGECYDVSRIGQWINALITRDVEVLDLRFFNEQRLPLPPELFTCSSSSKLVCLKLTEVFLLSIPPSTANLYLTSLKILHLHQVVFCSESFMNDLLDRCPMLEELDIEFDFCSIINTLFVRSSSLKSLRLDNQVAWCHGCQLGIAVHVTNLERLDLTCNVTDLCVVNSISSLNEVKLDIYGFISDSELIEAERLVELLRKMSNLKYMCLTNITMKTLGHACLDNLPKFRYLTRLELHVDEFSWHALSYLLECLPNLLTSLFYMVSASNTDEQWHQQFRTPRSLMLYLEDIEIRDFKGCANGMNMVRYFLKNATVLKKVSIRSVGSKTKEILEKLLTFPRTSTACQIASN